MRFGLHSGPVTAGVLRGEKSRFQLFGDTVNTAARMESLGIKSRIHISQETANLLVEAGKSRWVEPREELVTAKGKGQLQTYWLHAKGEANCNRSGHTDRDSDIGTPEPMSSITSDLEVANKSQRLGDWISEVLLGLLKQVVAARPKSSTKNVPEQKAIRDPRSKLEPRETRSRSSKKLPTSFHSSSLIILWASQPILKMWCWDHLSSSRCINTCGRDCQHVPTASLSQF
jgi:hypothetical protein